MPTYEPPPPAGAADAITVSFEGPGKRNRLTVAFRIILALPAFLWLYILGIAAFFAAVIGWIVAIFIGRLPNGFATFLGRFVQYNARFYAYTQYLLTDRYPPFALDARDGAVNVEFNPGRLNRAAVLFRLILAFPVAVVAYLVNGGVSAASPVVWLIILVTGRMPAPLFQAQAAVLRFQTRFWSYLLMLTGDYPRGLFGDDKAAAPSAPPNALPATPRITRLVLTRGAQRLVGLFIALGVLVGAGGIAAGAVTGARTSGAFRKLRAEDDALYSAKQQFDRDGQSCAISGGLDCLHSADLRFADAVSRFRTNVGNISFPVTASSEVETLQDDARSIEATLRTMAQKTTQADYAAAYQRLQSELETFGNDIDFAYSRS